MTDARYLTALYGDANPNALVELRYRVRDRMHRMFLGTDRLDRVEMLVAGISAQTDVYVGIVPRHQRGGGRKDLVGEAAVVWADCDTAESAAAARRFSPAPSIVVRSGTRDNIHAYWLLAWSTSVADIERANRRLAYALGADRASTDGARIIRPPGSRNWKHEPPALVKLDRCDPAARHALGVVVGELPDPPGVRSHDRSPLPDRGVAADSLLAIDPVTYVERLGGVGVSRGGKIACPFHDDSTPSLHVYDQPARGWFCFGCERGGGIYEFAAATWNLSTRGNDFHALRRRLTEVFLE